MSRIGILSGLKEASILKPCDFYVYIYSQPSRGRVKTRKLVPITTLFLLSAQNLSLIFSWSLPDAGS